jgi:hypothetical protein
VTDPDATPADPARPAGALPPFTGLTPDTVLDALDAVGLRGDGRLIQLNSYENRVFQVFLEDGRVVVAKFYRPERWTDAQILEEHALAAELMAEECPVVAPWALEIERDARLPARVCGPAGAPSTLVEVDTAGGPYRFAVVERRAGRAPELEAPGTLEWIGRLIGRMHLVGARRPFEHRTRLSVAGLGEASRDWLLASGMVPPDVLPGWLSAVNRGGPRSGANCLRQRAATRSSCFDCMETAISATSCGPTPVRILSTSTMPSPDRPCRTCGCCCPATAAPSGRASSNAVLDGLRTVHGLRPTASSALIEPLAQRCA